MHSRAFITATISLKWSSANNAPLAHERSLFGDPLASNSISSGRYSESGGFNEYQTDFVFRNGRFRNGVLKKNAVGSGIGAPQAYPPTAKVTPVTLLALSGTSTMLQLGAKTGAKPFTFDLLGTVKDRLFTTGPTNLLQLVKNVDIRLSGIDAQVAGNSTKPACLSETATDYSTVFAVPKATGTEGFPLFIQCKETYSGPNSTEQTGLVLVGKKDDTWYLLDGNVTTTSGVMGFYKVSGTSDADRVVDGYMMLMSSTAATLDDKFDGSTGVMHFYADVAKGTLEFTAGGVGFGFSQIHAKSNATHFYVELEVGDSVTTPSTLYTGCYTKTDLTETALVSTCMDQTDLTFSLVTLGTKAFGNTAGNSNVAAAPVNTSTAAKKIFQSY